jgi:formate hydrogenlyase subunit 6/NADH:ubiquinone oxidoreductase subunit I
MGGGKTGEAAMKMKRIKESHVAEWLNALIKKYRVVAPTQIRDKDFAFQAVTSAGEVALEFINPLISPVKDFLFPEKEVMLRYRKNGKTWDVEENLAAPETVLFGLRSCDLAAMRFMDRFFLEGFKDTYYEAKRKNLITVVMSCGEPMETCFCVCADCGPSSKEGFDLQLTKLDGPYLVEIGSAKGEELVNVGGSYFSEAHAEDLAAKEKLIEETKNNKFKMPTTYFSKAVRHMTANDINEKVWNRLGSRCMACGSCSYVCPTCTCFTVTDEGDLNEGQRVRTWDSCMYGGFTREVSGHNPRAVQKERVKRRYYHKLSYHYLTKMGCHGCVGCGRCVVACLGGIDMPMVSKAARRNE